MKEFKQVIVVRSDLKMGKGKIAAQASHASMQWIADKIMMCVKIDTYELNWLSGSMTKVVLKVDGEEELLKVLSKARNRVNNAYKVTDEGRTCFNGVPTVTCMAIGPDDPDAIDEITGTLKLL